MNPTLDLSFIWSFQLYFFPSFFFPSVFTQQNGQIVLLAYVCYLTCQKMLFLSYTRLADKNWQSSIGCEIIHITPDLLLLNAIFNLITFTYLLASSAGYRNQRIEIIAELGTHFTKHLYEVQPNITLSVRTANRHLRKHGKTIRPWSFHVDLNFVWIFKNISFNTEITQLSYNAHQSWCLS